MVKIFYKNEKTGALIAEDFKELSSFLQYGKTNEDSDVIDSENNNFDELDTQEKDLIYAIRVRNEGLVITQQYYLELNQKVTIFLAEADGLINDKLLQQYDNSIKILENAVNYAKKRDDLTEEFLSGGESAAKERLNQIACSTNTGTLLYRICDLENIYYEKVIEELALYSANGCNIEKGFYIECIMQKNNDELFDKMTDLDSDIFYSKNIANSKNWELISSEILKITDKILGDFKDA